MERVMVTRKLTIQGVEYNVSIEYFDGEPEIIEVERAKDYVRVGPNNQLLIAIYAILMSEIKRVLH